MKLKLLTLQILLLLSFAAFAQQRGRVKIQDGTIVSDRGTLLRGAHISTDMFNKLPPRSYVAGIKNLGLNTVHLYAECSDNGTPGKRMTLIDELVKWTREESLYLIITIGGCSKNGAHDLNFVKGFWNIYAPRYKNETHVVYEIMNEPFGWSSPYDQATIDMEREAYNLIRSKAPDTHIELMGYSQPKNVSTSINEIKNLGIDWENASIAIHGYEVTSQSIRSYIRAIQQAGYAISVTEPASVADKYMSYATTRAFEDEFVSYQHFIDINRIIENPNDYKTLVENSNLRWTPDFGIWPKNITQTVFRSPYQNIDFAYYDDGFGYASWGGFLQHLDNNDFIAFYTMDFKNGPISFSAEISSKSLGGTIELHLGKVDGPLIGTCNVTTTGSYDVKKMVTCSTSAITGVKDIFIVFKGITGFNPFYVHSFSFKQSPVKTNQTINFPVLPEKKLGDIDFSPGATTTSGLAISYTSSNLSVAQIIGGNIRLVGIGTTNITASQFGNASFNPAASISRSLIVSKASVPKGPYTGTPISIPGTIEAENFDRGGQGVSYNDKEEVNIGGSSYRIDGVDIATSVNASYFVGWTAVGEWMEYSVNVASAGSYEFEFRTSSAIGGGIYSVMLDGNILLANKSVSLTQGWDIYTSSIWNANLPSGNHIIRFKIDAAGFNIDKIIVRSVATNPCTGNIAPVVSLTSPITNASYDEGTSVTLSVNATDNGSIAQVEYFDGSISLGKSIASPFSISMTSLAIGTHTIIAVAKDNCGATKTSSPSIIAIKKIIVNTDPIVGPSCASKSTTISYELNPSYRTNVTGYSWWFSGSQAVVTPVAGSPFKATVVLSDYYSGGSACVGLNLSVAPYYMSYCKVVGVCGARIGTEDMMVETSSSADKAKMYPNPTSADILFIESNELVKAIEIKDAMGVVVKDSREISNDSGISLQGLSMGNYTVKIIFENDVLIKKLCIIK